ncbi:MAG: hypothetical protein ACK56I_33070, partial [bacterium]
RRLGMAINCTTAKSAGPLTRQRAVTSCQGAPPVPPPEVTSLPEPLLTARSKLIGHSRCIDSGSPENRKSWQ